MKRRSCWSKLNPSFSRRWQATIEGLYSAFLLDSKMAGGYNGRTLEQDPCGRHQMPRNANQDGFAYEFEQPILEVERRIKEFSERAASEHEDLSAEIEKLEHERDRLLEETFGNLTAYQRVRLARHPKRPHPTDYVEMIFTDLMELHGDRRFGDDRAVLTFLGRLDEHKVLVVANQKGRETQEKMRANFGMPRPEGYRKALHKMHLAEKFGLPVVSLIDTPGAAPSIGAEERGQAMAIAENLFMMAGLRVPIVIAITGEGCSGGALGIGVGDRFAMLENAYYSVISPEGCAAILWKDGDKASEAAETMRLTAGDLLEAGVIDTIIPEPLGGAHRDPQRTARELERYLTDALEELVQVPVDQLLEQRYEHYRALGVYREVPASAGGTGE
ncbi:MAG: acetyl-CoA carboxylase carboxyltransferase subunit alpha [Candidatus Brocadiaceae bacterium]|jgi:acetyl-CoA carboxylase carboxyl transferase subunit alpha